MEGHASQLTEIRGRRTNVQARDVGLNEQGSCGAKEESKEWSRRVWHVEKGLEVRGAF
jgi:hypothetical protein